MVVVAIPGAAGVRLAAEAAVRRRGWPVVSSPADADLVVVTGRPGPAMTGIVEQVWAQTPGPRVRLVAESADEVEELLDRAAMCLAAGGTTADDAPAADHPPSHHHPGPAPEHGEHSDDLRDARAHGGDEHGGHEHGGHEHGAGGHDHGGMAMPGGLAMADLGEDRDGLALDRLHVPLGPVLPDWPAGLVLHLALQGDVVQEARAEVLDAPERDGFPDVPGAGTARRLDALARVLGVAGLGDRAADARRLRDDLLTGAHPEAVDDRVRTLVRAVRRSRWLRWGLRGLTVTGTPSVTFVDLLERRLAALESGTGSEPRPASQTLGAALVGMELAAARLAVALLDPDTSTAAGAETAHHG
ncbi:hypothetical protein [Pseudonocardia sp. WMMC193]|uniref:hypothetical protein n=1 Tax=Pseudonocardia sp. WMMC193 TaxID=2911965 RepID=UPI001F2E0BA3|nr:hypothetical protein [Pseudonocardia sp. WMMC193]MCF7552672.1 hypothetical protein [Pseudonocardia sp. WMMC193]